MADRIKSRQKAIYTEKLYCRKCQKTKGATSFPTAVDPILDTNGYMSVCKMCCDDVYEMNYMATNDLYKALFLTCQMLNIAYIEDVVNGVEKRILTKQSKGQRVEKIFGLYKQTLAGSSNVGANYKTLTFSQSNYKNDDGTPQEEPEFDSEEEARTYDELVYEWGKGWDLDVYEWLEKKFRYWSGTHKCDTPAERTLLKEIVWKEFQIEQSRSESKPTGGLVKELQDLMKTAAVDPAKASSDNAGKAHENFSDFITTIEQKEPAEVFGDERNAFKDWQNIGWYFDNYVVRPIKNFVVGSKDFSIESEDPDTEEEGIQEYLSYDEDD